MQIHSRPQHLLAVRDQTQLGNLVKHSQTLTAGPIRALEMLTEVVLQEEPQGPSVGLRSTVLGLTGSRECLSLNLSSHQFCTHNVQGFFSGFLPHGASSNLLPPAAPGSLPQPLKGTVLSPHPPWKPTLKFLALDLMKVFILYAFFGHKGFLKWIDYFQSSFRVIATVRIFYNTCPESLQIAGTEKVVAW